MRAIHYLTLPAMVLGLSLAMPVASYADHHGEGAKKERESHFSEENRALVRETMQSLRESNSAKMKEISELRKKQAEILGAESFDSAAFSANQAQMSSLMQAIQSERAAAIAGLASQLSAEERKALSKMMSGPRKWSRNKEKGKDGEAKREYRKKSRD